MFLEGEIWTQLGILRKTINTRNLTRQLRFLEAVYYSNKFCRLPAVDLWY